VSAKLGAGLAGSNGLSSGRFHGRLAQNESRGNFRSRNADITWKIDLGAEMIDVDPPLLPEAILELIRKRVSNTGGARGAIAVSAKIDQGSIFVQIAGAEASIRIADRELGRGTSSIHWGGGPLWSWTEPRPGVS